MQKPCVMDFEPFHSDEDEELASIMPEKKKKDGEKWKRAKGPAKFRNEKKMTYNDIHSPPGVKGKHSVHGVVGPAEYIRDQTNSPVTDQAPASITQGGAVLPAVSIASNNDANPIGVVHINPATRTEMLTQQSAPIVKQPIRMDYSQSQHSAPAISQKQLHSTPTPHFRPNFPPVSSMPAKIDRDRPHFSPAALPPGGQGPTPFKHQPSQANTPGKPTLLSQAMTATQIQQPSPVQQPPMQVTAGNHTGYHRTQSYHIAVTATKPIPIPEPTSKVNERSVNTSSQQENTELSAAQDVVDGGHTRGPVQSTQMSPFGTEVLVDGSWPQPDGKLPASQEYIDSAEWANFHPALNLQDNYDGDDNRRKSHGTDSLSESIPESMSSVESEQEDSVWKINEEQREYYTKQFMKIQPNVGEVIKGPQARDFFLKSNLPTETLSTIWQLSDMDKDAALNLNEFCIAMHLVVAVKHGLDLPTMLPPTLIYPSGSFSEEPLSEEVQPVVEESDDEDEIKNSSISDDASLSSSVEASTTNLTSDIRHPTSLQHDLDTRDGVFADSTHINTIDNSVYNTPMKETVSAQSAIARPRASAQKNVNLMDASPWQLLPPPSSRGKPVVKKALNMDDDAAFTSTESIEQMNSFSSPELSNKDMSSVFLNDSDVSNKTNNSQTKSKSRRLSKEKSRSIDSLRLDIDENHAALEMRRMSKESRPRSFSGEGIHVNGGTKGVTKEMEIPPIPPPRTMAGHMRAASLDLNRIIDSRPDSLSASQDMPPAALRLTNSSLDSSNTSISRRDVINSSSRLGGSNVDVGSRESPSPTSIMATSPQNIMRRRSSAGDAVRHMVRFSDELDVLDDGSSKLIDKKMRKHEVQARVRLLKSNNTMLNNLLTQLHEEWKSVSEERIALDILLQKEKQHSKLS